MEWWQILLIIFFATLCASVLIDQAKKTKRPKDLSIDVILIDLMKALQPNNRFYPETADESMHLAKAKERILALIAHRLGVK